MSPGVPNLVESLRYQQRLESGFVHRKISSHRLDTMNQPRPSPVVDSTIVRSHRYQTRLQAKRLTVDSSCSADDERSFGEKFWNKRRKSAFNMKSAS